MYKYKRPITTSQSLWLEKQFSFLSKKRKKEEEKQWSWAWHKQRSNCQFLVLSGTCTIEKTSDFDSSYKCLFWYDPLYVEINSDILTLIDSIDHWMLDIHPKLISILSQKQLFSMRNYQVWEETKV